MALEDRDWYWTERQRKERLHYDPKAFRRWRGDDASSAAPRGGRPGFGTVVAVVFLIGLTLAPTAGRWLQKRFSTDDAGVATTAPPRPQAGRAPDSATRP